jgi:nucleoside-diphosphate-sugar epimerase
MNIMVVGGSGLFGRKTIIHLLCDDAVSSVISLDVNPPPDWFAKSIQNRAGKFRLVRADVSQIEDLLDAIKKYSVDRIINMAFILTGAFELNPRLAIKVNALGMCNIFEAARIMGISRIVYASSVAVYGPQSEYGDREVNEDDQLHPGNGYGVTKHLSEIVAGQYARLYGMKSSAIRPFLGYGHGGIFPPIIITSLITGALVSISGMIGFVGLIIPHMMRLVVGPNHKALIPATCLAAAAFLVLCDTVSRSLLPPVEIPIGVITSLIGAPLFILLLKRKQKVT